MLNVCLFVCVCVCVCMKGSCECSKISCFKECQCVYVCLFVCLCVCVCVSVCVREREIRREGSEILVNQYCPKFFCTSLASFFSFVYFSRNHHFLTLNTTKPFFRVALKIFTFCLCLRTTITPLKKSFQYDSNKNISICFLISKKVLH